MKNTFFISLLILGLLSCGDGNHPTQLQSTSLAEKDTRIERLQKEIVAPSAFENAEFDLFNVNGFSNSRTTLPGASSWDYKFVVKVQPSNVPLWTQGMQRIDSLKDIPTWAQALVRERSSEWKTHTSPEFFTKDSGQVTLIVYNTEGIIFKRIENR